MLHGWQREGSDLPALNGDDMHLTLTRQGSHDAAARLKAEIALPEPPMRAPDLAVRDGGHRFRHAVRPQPVDVPPAGAIGAEVQNPGGGPFGLNHRLPLVGAHHDRGIFQAGRQQPRGVQPRGIPGHVRVIPGQPCEVRSVGGRPRGGVEVGTPNEHCPVIPGRVFAGGDVQHDDRGLGVEIRARPAILPHANDRIGARNEPEIGVTTSRRRRDFPGNTAGRDQPYGTVDFVAEDDAAVADRIGPAAIFVHAAPHVERRRRHVLRRLVRQPANQHRPALLRGSRLQPIEHVAVGGHVSQAHHARGHGLGRQRRYPGSIGSGLHWCARHGRSSPSG